MLIQSISSSLFFFTLLLKYFLINNSRVKRYFEVLPGNDTLVINYEYERGFSLYRKILTKHFLNGSPDVVDSLGDVRFTWEGGNLTSLAIRDYKPDLMLYVPRIIYYIDYYSLLAPFNFIQFNDKAVPIAGRINCNNFRI